MGFLETRALDFENVYVLSVNEGILPASGDNRSFIPYSLRKGFGLSTYEEQDSSYAYHFYRLLQRSRNVHLLYNTEVGKTTGGEPGRYLLQIRHELKPFMGENLQLADRIISTPVIRELVEKIQVIKTDEVIDQLNNYLLLGGFSSSALTTYIHCQLQFYFRYLARIKEQDQLAETIEADIFGNILHDVMEIVYSDKSGQVVNTEDFDYLFQKTEEAVKAAVLENFHANVSELEGYDILLVEVIRNLAKQILLNDQKDTPFMIRGLEKEFAATILVDDRKVTLKGRFDRVDERSGVTRIIDYKTGKIEIKTKPVPELFSNPDGKALFQLYFYSLLYDKNHHGAQIRPGFYVARDLSGGITSAMNGAVITSEILNEFETELKMMIKNIFDPEIKFIQTEDVKRCIYCEYRAICHR
jgi:RecB family exonuclease